MVRILKGSTRTDTYGSANIYDSLFFALAKAKTENETPALITVDMPAAEIHDFVVPAYHDEFVRFIKPLDPRHVVSGIPLSKERTEKRLRYWQNIGRHFQAPA